MFTLSFHTLGCKLNQLETEAVAQAFLAESFRVVPWGEPADLFVVNTCTVTSKAEQKGRRIMRQALKDNPSACLIATGCYAQLEGEALETLVEGRRIVVVTGDAKASLLDLPAFLAGRACSSADLPPLLHAWSRGQAADSASGEDCFRFDTPSYAFHTRASLKIQDGCDNLCAFCRVRLARGRSRSLDGETVLSRLQALEGAGHAEAVLTGVNLNQYNDGVRNLSALLAYLLDGTERIALRISSTEPEGVDDDFVRVAARGRIRPHFHLSVQSGSDAVLRRMRRRYRAADVEEAAARLRAAAGDPFLACDIIAGFPGEREEDFEETYELCRRIGFAWIHAFPFSPRPGTEAARLDGPVDQRTAGYRVERLGSLALEGRAAYLARWTGRTVDAVVERSSDDLKGGWATAVSANYLKLLVPVPPGRERPSPGSTIRCTIAALPGHAEASADASADAVAEWLYTDG